MVPTNEPLRIREEDLYSAKVDAYVEEQDMLRRPIHQWEPQPLWKRVLFSNCFYLSIACGLGALLAWGILEPFTDDFRGEDSFAIANFLLFPTVAGFIGLSLGTAEGAMCRNAQRALLSGLVGLGIGFAGGVVAVFVAGFLFVITTALAVALSPDFVENGYPKGMGLLVFMSGRSAAWAIASLPAGLGQGIALRELKVAVVGLVGGALGGMLGGFLFDPIDLIFTSEDGDASLSRAIGFVTIGVMVGLFVGLVEQWSRTAWLLMKAGPLAGKQFVVYRNPTVLGSSPKADIYLFKDAAIEPKHALIHDLGGRFEIEDCDTKDGTYVNGIPVRRQLLHAGDQIVLGETILEFSLREST